jgi:hypothetical protein
MEADQLAGRHPEFLEAKKLACIAFSLSYYSCVLSSVSLRFPHTDFWHNSHRTVSVSGTDFCKEPEAPVTVMV